MKTLQIFRNIFLMLIWYEPNRLRYRRVVVHLEFSNCWLWILEIMHHRRRRPRRNECDI